MKSSNPIVGRSSVIATLRVVRCPFTLAMLAALIVAGVYGRTHVGTLHANIRHHAGYSVRLLWEGELHRGFTSVFIIAGEWRFYSSLMMLAVAVAGSKCAMERYAR